MIATPTTGGGTEFGLLLACPHPIFIGSGGLPPYLILGVGAWAFYFVKKGKNIIIKIC
jgi:hypothetical protein